MNLGDARRGASEQLALGSRWVRPSSPHAEETQLCPSLASYKTSATLASTPRRPSRFCTRISCSLRRFAVVDGREFAVAVAVAVSLDQTLALALTLAPRPPDASGAAAGRGAARERWGRRERLEISPNGVRPPPPMVSSSSGVLGGAGVGGCEFGRHWRRAGGRYWCRVMARRPHEVVVAVVTLLASVDAEVCGTAA